MLHHLEAIHKTKQRTMSHLHHLLAKKDAHGRFYIQTTKNVSFSAVKKAFRKAIANTNDNMAIVNCFTGSERTKRVLHKNITVYIPWQSNLNAKQLIGVVVHSFKTADFRQGPNGIVYYFLGFIHSHNLNLLLSNIIPFKLNCINKQSGVSVDTSCKKIHSKFLKLSAEEASCEVKQTSHLITDYLSTREEKNTQLQLEIREDSPDDRQSAFVLMTSETSFHGKRLSMTMLICTLKLFFDAIMNISAGNLAATFTFLNKLNKQREQYPLCFDLSSQILCISSLRNKETENAYVEYLSEISFYLMSSQRGDRETYNRMAAFRANNMVFRPHEVTQHYNGDICRYYKKFYEKKAHKNQQSMQPKARKFFGEEEQPLNSNISLFTKIITKQVDRCGKMWEQVAAPDNTEGSFLHL